MMIIVYSYKWHPSDPGGVDDGLVRGMVDEVVYLVGNRHDGTLLPLVMALYE